MGWDPLESYVFTQVLDLFNYFVYLLYFFSILGLEMDATAWRATLWKEGLGKIQIILISFILFPTSTPEDAISWQLCNLQ